MHTINLKLKFTQHPYSLVQTIEKDKTSGESVEKNGYTFILGGINEDGHGSKQNGVCNVENFIFDYQLQTLLDSGWTIE